MRTIKFRAFDIEKKVMIQQVSHVQRDGLVVMQFTNFKDHTGTEIYDKDVVRFTNPSPKKNNKRPVIDMVVGWKANRGCWALFWRGTNEELFWSSLGKQLDDNHAVVGNAYENPDLIK
jgi:hypothetical protein